MPNQSLLALVVTALALLPEAAHTKTIYTCKDVDCPRNQNNTAEASCTVAGSDFSVIGNTRIPTTNKAIDGMSWTKAISLRESNSGALDEVHQAYYLGTPPNLNLTGTRACGIIYQIPIKHFTDNAEQDVNGTCQQAMTESCVSALLDRAKSFNPSEWRPSAISLDLCSSFLQHMSKPCATFPSSWSAQALCKFPAPANAPLHKRHQTLTFILSPLQLHGAE
jgi:hypothetical protein